MKKSLIEIKGVSAGYGTKLVLHPTTVGIFPNELVMICGPNGGGKTTLLRILAGLLKPRSGELKAQPDLIIGYLPQFRGIDRNFPITVEETVLSGLSCRKPVWKAFNAQHHKTVMNLLEQFQLEDLAKRPINALSGGQWQRTLIARSLVSNPELWLLDEPSTHLDEEGKSYLLQVLQQEAGKRAIAVVTHNPEEMSTLPVNQLWEVNEGVLQVKRLSENQ